MNDPAAEKARIGEILDFTEIKKLFEHFSVVTGLDIALFDVAGKELLSVRLGGSICAAAKNGPKCREMAAYAAAAARELGEPYIYPCGCGLIMCSSPVMFNEDLAGSIACGPAILWDADELAQAELAEKIRAFGIGPNFDNSGDFIRSFLRHTPPYECVNITGAAQILFIMVNSLTREHSVYLNQRALITKQQERIAELIMDRKAEAGRGKRSPVPAYPLETEKELIAFVQSGNRRQAAKILNSLLSEIFLLAEGNMDTVRVKLFELVAFLSRTAVDAGAPLREVNAVTKASFEICEEGAGFERLCFLTTRALDGFIDTVYRRRKQKRTGGHLSKAAGLIQRYYAGDLTLRAVASKIYVSEYYLSHLFRKEMGMTFSDYVTKVRIAKARGFFQEDPDMRVQQIAEKTGFTDANYFAKVFKKITGVSPREYQGFFR